MKKQRTFKFMSALMAALMLPALMPMGAWAQPIATTDETTGLYSLIEGFENEELGSSYASASEAGKLELYAIENAAYEVVADGVHGKVMQATRKNVSTANGPRLTIRFPKITEGVWELSYDFKQESYSGYYNTVFVNIDGFTPYRQYNNNLANAASQADAYRDENGKPLVDLTKWTKLTNVFDYNNDLWTLKAQNIEDGGSEIVLETKKISDIGGNVADPTKGINYMHMYSYYLAAQTGGTYPLVENAKAWWDNISVVQTAKKRVAPKVTANIADGAAGVSLDEEFTLTFNQDMNKATYDGIQLKNKTTGAAMTATIGTETATTVSFRAPGLLDELTEYEIVVPSTVQTADGQSAAATISFATTARPDFYLHENFDAMGELSNMGEVADYFNKNDKDFYFSFRALNTPGGTSDMESSEQWNKVEDGSEVANSEKYFKGVNVTASNGRMAITRSADSHQNLYILSMYYPNKVGSINTVEKIKLDVETDRWPSNQLVTSTGGTNTSLWLLNGGTLNVSAFNTKTNQQGQVVAGNLYDGKKHTIELVTDYENCKMWAYFDGVKSAEVTTKSGISTNSRVAFWNYADAAASNLYLDNFSVSELARPEVLKIADVKAGNRPVVMLNTPADAQAMVVKDSTGNVVSGTWTVDATKTKYTFSETLDAGSYSVTMPKDTLSTDGIATLADATTDFAVKATVNDIEVVDMTVLNGTGDELTDVSKAGSILVKAQLQNNKAEAITPFVGVAVYDAEGKLLNIAYSNESIPTGGKTVKLTVSAKGAATAKIFTWDKMGTLSPLASATVK